MVVHSLHFVLKLLTVVLLTAAPCLPLGDGLERRISSELNPHCTLAQCNTSHYSVVYVKAEGPNDTLHYVWDLTAKPSVLLALTDKDSNLTIDWRGFIDGEDGSLTFSTDPLYSFGIIIDKVWEFNDVNDTGMFRADMNSSYIKELDTQFFNWNRTQFREEEKSMVLTAEANGYNDSVVTKNGTLRVEVEVFGFNDHSENLPHLLHTSNTTQVDMVFDRLTTDPSFNNSRFAVEFVIVSQDQRNGTMIVDVRKSLDDEHTPGVFTLVDVESPSSHSRSSGGYLQWKPVAYLAQNRDISNSTVTNVYGPIKSPPKALDSSLLSAYYGSQLTNGSQTLVQAVTVSFGESDDGFYKKTKYTSWTFAIGYGKPPNEDFSLLVILVISIGLGLPALLVVISGIVMSIRKISQNKDDLLLSS
ncbi:glycosylated lysosomal membrane protein-like [Schistocerca nitens]|uniref:glycosylated lysosomal membrane protein-like n=1 Tax=Schistocerca nitens TaxID=7011 RepID=UPI0021196C49|nr:glycosylated lysosomal membrane protein-like [Schistocerca nitens]XP_049791118.1 glycosylated lysosomal membrane protein-like [Schistocerca nitens]XP_049791119.1 glycosylated lysosomal membrane protein-like [Schistocerca nitens]